MLWTGTKESCEAFFTACNSLMPGILTLTYEISVSSVVFLDMIVFRGGNWEQSGMLDTTCYQKPVNRYLYIPFCSELPLATLRGWIKAEITRYLKRCSRETDYLDMLVLFWARLRARGYPESFLCGLFDKAPLFTQREALLYKDKPARNDRIQCLITEYSHAKHRLKLGEIMHMNKHLLPAHLQGEFILAYRALPKLGTHLCTYRFPRMERAQRIQP